MSAPDRPTATVSTKGQLVLPLAIRRALGWEAGTRLIVESTGDGVLLRREPAFPKTRPEDVYGRLPRKGPPKSADEMGEAVLEEAERRHAGG